MSSAAMTRRKIASSKPMKDGLGNWYRTHDFEVTEIRLESKLEWLTPKQAKSLLEILEEPA